uniref:LCCL domain-containing protein n=1 Tax=Mesocestoides corti TaxID=53468 RepID=A0A5K3EUD8_MESCO
IFCYSSTVLGIEAESENSFPPDGNAVYCSGTADSCHLGAQSLAEGNRHGVVTTSCDRGCDFRLHGVMRALNDAPGTESQFAHEFSVSFAAPRNGPVEEQDNQDKDI